MIDFIYIATTSYANQFYVYKDLYLSDPVVEEGTT